MLQEYLEKEDMVLSWQSFLENKNKERQDALQKQEAESVSAQEQAEDSEEMGEEVPDQG
jgi:23S rRNA maturation mini-RNase III